MRRSLLTLVLVSSGCGLTLDLTPNRGAVDAGRRDTGTLDSGPTDAPVSDALLADAPLSDVLPDGPVRDEIPQVVGIKFDRGAAELTVPSRVTREYFLLPRSVRDVVVLVDAPMEIPVFTAELQTLDFIVLGTGRVAGESTQIEFSVPDGLADGWHCIVVDGSSETGVFLDGEWAGRLPSGDGIEGGAFRFVFGVLNGDVDGDGSVTNADFMTVVDAMEPEAMYDPYSDFDGDGDVDGDDFLVVQAALEDAVTLPPPDADLCR